MSSGTFRRRETIQRPFDIANLTETQIEKLKRSVDFNPKNDEFTNEFFYAIMQPTYYGPTWRQKDGEWDLPEYSLGWEAILWMSSNLSDPHGDKPNFELTPEQARFLVHWYAIDEAGAWIWTRGVLQRCKGWGKDPFIAAIALFEMLGPCRFLRWHYLPDGSKLPIAVKDRAPNIITAAVNQEQSTNTSDMIPLLLSKEKQLEYEFKLGVEKMRADRGRCQLRFITGEPNSKEGQRPTLVICNEAHRWVDSVIKGHKLHGILERNAGKVGGRLLHITNAYQPGEESVLEYIHAAHLAAEEQHALDPEESPPSLWMWDSIEAHPRAPVFGPLARYCLDKCRGDSWWLPVDTLADEFETTSQSKGELRRFYLNQTVAADDALVSSQEWDRMKHVDLTFLEPVDEIVMGFDGGKSDDSTALVAIRLRDRAIFRLGLWENPNDGNYWEVDRRSVDQMIRYYIDTHRVLALYCDYSQWESYIDRWAEEFGHKMEVKAQGDHPLKWDMRGGGSVRKVAQAHERFLTAVRDGDFKHDGDAALKRHALNAQAVETPHGLTFRKSTTNSRNKCDLYAAMILANEAYLDHRLQRRTQEVRRPGNVYFF